MSLTQNTTFYRFQCDPTFDDTGHPVTAVVQAFWQTTVRDGDNTVASTVKMEAQWDAVTNAAKTVSYNGQTYTYAEVLGVVMAIATQERASQAK